jgi:nucleotide-binding universal stress UspA family protein
MRLHPPIAMFHPRCILHPTDFSDSAIAAFGHAQLLARRFDAQLHVLHAVRLAPEPGLVPFPNPFFYPEGHSEALLEEARAELEAYVAPAREGGLPVHVVPPRFDTPTIAILTQVRETGADLVVMGTHGRKGVVRALLGSVAEGVLRHAPCSVLTVHARPDSSDTSSPVRRVLVPVDLHYHAAEAVQTGVELAVTYGADLTLLHVVDVARDPALAPLSLEVRERRLRQSEAVARLHLQTLRAGLDADIPPTTVHVLSGDPWDEVPACVERLEADLVVAPSHDLKGFDRLLMGSIAERIARVAPHAALVVKPDTPRPPAPASSAGVLAPQGA